jgi:hypothetical protein
LDKIGPGRALDVDSLRGNPMKVQRRRRHLDLVRHPVPGYLVLMRDAVLDGIGSGPARFPDST